jgi:hypothetical protein
MMANASEVKRERLKRVALDKLINVGANEYIPNKQREKPVIKATVVL